MSHPKDRVGKTLRKCLKMLKHYHAICVGGDWGEEPEVAALIKEVEKTILYREAGPT
jgi:hypothetical protein